MIQLTEQEYADLIASQTALVNALLAFTASHYRHVGTVGFACRCPECVTARAAIASVNRKSE